MHHITVGHMDNSKGISQKNVLYFPTAIIEIVE